jgi:hypothetical protein
MIGVPGGDDARELLGSAARSWPSSIVKHPTHRRWGEMQTGASEDLGDLHVPEGRAESFQAPHDVTDELGKAIDRFGQLDECVGPFLFESGHPRGDGERAHQEDPRRLSESPAASGAKLENGQSGCRGIVRSSVRLDLLHPGVLDADLRRSWISRLSPSSSACCRSSGFMLSDTQPRVSANEVLAREMTWTTAERTRRGQPRGSGRGWDRAIGGISVLLGKAIS